MIDVTCPNCGKTFRAPDSAAGKRGRCKACGTMLDLPTAMEPEPLVDAPAAGGIDFSRRAAGALADPGRVTVDVHPTALVDTGEADDEPAGPAAYGLRWEYKFVSMSAYIEPGFRENKREAAAAHLGTIVGKHAVQGWEFYRTDPVGVLVPPGCIGALFGFREQVIQYHVVTFRRRTTWEA